MIAIVEHLKDLVWPRVCQASDCARPSDRLGRYLCSRCYRALPWYDEYPHASVAYLDPIPMLLKRWKFGDARYLTEDLVDMLENGYRAKYRDDRVDFVTAVPLFWGRERERGFNQSELLAKGLAKRMGLRFCNNAVVRYRDTEHQARSDKKERARNLKGAFQVKDPELVKGKSIVLIDDVITTTSTLAECSDALIRAGAKCVVPFAVAKALRDEDFDEL